MSFSECRSAIADLDQMTTTSYLRSKGASVTSARCREIAYVLRTEQNAVMSWLCWVTTDVHTLPTRVAPKVRQSLEASLRSI